MLGNKKIVITGAGGFIGSHVVEGIQARLEHSSTCQLYAVGRSLGKLSQLKRRNGFSFHTCDLLHRETLYPLLASINPHLVIHLASEPDAPESVVHSQNCIANNLIATVNLADAFASSKNPEGMVYGDSTKSYGSAPSPYRSDVRPEPNSSYSITKAAGWDFIKLQAKLSGFSAVAIRPTLIYGARQPKNIIGVLYNAILEKQPSFAIQGGSQTRAPLHIDDAVDAFLRAANHVKKLNFKVINIGGAEELTVAEIARCVVQSVGSDMEIICNDTMRQTEIFQSTVDLSEARDLLGWKPSIPFFEGLVSCREQLVEKTA
ncbi:MAG: NAD(P)-dependent oxidoreductase [Candidatus Hydrogenedentota bacterium]